MQIVKPTGSAVPQNGSDQIPVFLLQLKKDGFADCTIYSYGRDLVRMAKNTDPPSFKLISLAPGVRQSTLSGMIRAFPPRFPHSLGRLVTFIGLIIQTKPLSRELSLRLIVPVNPLILLSPNCEFSDHVEQ